MKNTKKLQFALNNRILILDGAMGTMIQAYPLEEDSTIFAGNVLQSPRIGIVM